MKHWIAPLSFFLIISIPVFAQRQLRMREAFYFQVGDEIHTVDDFEMYVCSPGGTQYDYYKKKVIGRYFSTLYDTLYLEWQIQHTYYKWFGQFDRRYVTNTTFETEAITYLDSTVKAIYIYGDTTQQGSYLTESLRYDTLYNGRLVNQYSYSNGFEGHYDYTFIEGLGGWYGWYTVAPSAYGTWLRYYKKGIEEWGNKIKVGIEENVEDTHIGIFPNPTKGTFTITGEESAFDKLEIFNVGGKLVYSVSGVGFKRTFDVSDLTPGIYILHLYQDNSISQFKIVKD